MQVGSSLRMNILRAMAAFAGSAILLMDFGVTNWVCFQMPHPPPQWENMENGRVISRRGGRQKFTALGGQGPGLWQGLPVPLDPMSMTLAQACGWGERRDSLVE